MDAKAPLPSIAFAALLAGAMAIAGAASSRTSTSTFVDNASLGANTFTTGAFGGCSGVFGQDSFTGTTGTALGSHVPEIGGGWTAIANGGSAIIDNNNVKSNSNAEILWKIDPAPCDNSYAVSLDVTTGSSVASRCAGPAGRLADASNYYRARLCGNGVVTLEKVVGGAVTSLGSFSITSFSTTTFYAIKLELTDATKKVFVDGTERISSADNALTGAASAGLRHDGGATMRGDNFIAEQVP